jgi:hypothetical protein
MTSEVSDNIFDLSDIIQTVGTISLDIDGASQTTISIYTDIYPTTLYTITKTTEITFDISCESEDLQTVFKYTKTFTYDFLPTETFFPSIRLDNLQPDLPYYITMEISTDDVTLPIYKGSTFLSTLDYHPPNVTMLTNKDNKIVLYLSPFEHDDPLPHDATYYISYFIHNDPLPQQLTFHKVYGDIYIIPDSFILTGGDKLEVLAFIRYVYEKNEDDLITDLITSSGMPQAYIVIDNTVPTSNYMLNTRRGVLTEDQYPHPQYS